MLSLTLMLLLEGTKSSACGGVIRNHKGDWLKGFCSRNNPSPPTTAELFGIKLGLDLCWNQALRKIEVGSGTIEALNLILRGNVADHPFHGEILDIRNLLLRLASYFLY